jgi:hypothetical protein
MSKTATRASFDAGATPVAPAIIDREAALYQKHALTYWQNRALALAQQVEDMRASLEEKVKEAVEAKLAEAGKTKAK